MLKEKQPVLMHAFGFRMCKHLCQLVKFAACHTAEQKAKPKIWGLLTEPDKVSAC